MEKSYKAKRIARKALEEQDDKEQVTLDRKDAELEQSWLAYSSQGQLEHAIALKSGLDWLEGVEKDFADLCLVRGKTKDNE